MAFILLGLGSLVLGAYRCHEVGVRVLEFALERVDVGALASRRLGNSVLLITHVLVESLLLMLVQQLSLTQLLLVAAHRQYNTIQYNIKTCNAPYVTRMLIVGAGMTRD